MGDNIMDVDKMFLMLKDFQTIRKGPAMVDVGSDEADTKAYEAYRAAGNAITKENSKTLHNSPKFNEFYKANKESFKKLFVTYNAPVHTTEDGKVDVLKTAAMEDVTPEDRTAARNNMLIDMAANALGSSHGAHINFQTGQYETLKAASRMERILHDDNARKTFLDKYCGGSMTKLSDAIHDIMAKDLANGDSPYTTLDKFAQDYVSPSTPGDFGDYVDKHMNLMAGNDLIGIFAVNSSCHYKYQSLGLKLPEGRKIPMLINGRQYELEDVDAVISVINGRRIGNIMAELQAAAPDNGKDPVLGDCNANNNTASRMGFLAALGLDPIDITIINDAVVESVMTNKEFTEGIEPSVEFNGDINRLSELCYKVNESSYEELTQDEMEELAAMVQWYNNIDECAAFRKQSQDISRCDSQNGAVEINTSDVLVQQEKAKKFYNTARSKMAPIVGFENFININIDYNDESTWPKVYRYADGSHDERFMKMMSQMGRMQAYYTLGHKSAVALASKYLKNLQAPMSRAVDVLKYMGGVDYFTRKRQDTVMRRFLNDFATYALMDMPMLSEQVTGRSLQEIRDYYIHDFPLKLNLLINAKDDHGKPLHPDLRTPIVNRLTLKTGSGITASSINKTTELIRTMLTKSFDYMSASNDPVVRDVVTDMILYEIFNDGLNYNPNGYGIFASCDLIDRVTNGEFADALTNSMDKILMSDEKMAKFIDQFLHNDSTDAVKNFSTLSRIRPFSFMKRSESDDAKGVPIAVEFNGADHNRFVKRIDNTGNIGYLDYINVDSALYALDKTRSNHNTAVYTKEAVRDYKTPAFYDPNSTEMIDYSSLADYGYVVSAKSISEAEGYIKQVQEGKINMPISQVTPVQEYSEGMSEVDMAAATDRTEDVDDVVMVDLGNIDIDENPAWSEEDKKLIESCKQEISILKSQNNWNPTTIKELKERYPENIANFCII